MKYQNPLDEYETAVDAKYKSIKEALRLLRTNQTMIGTTTVESVNKLVNPPVKRLRRGKITKSVVSAIESFGEQEFTLSQLSLKVPFVNKLQISSVLTRLQKDNRIVATSHGRGKKPSIYKQVAIRNVPEVSSSRRDISQYPHIQPS